MLLGSLETVEASNVDPFLKPPSRGHFAFLGVLATVLSVAAIVWSNVTGGVAGALFAIYAFVNAIG